MASNCVFNDIVVEPLTKQNSGAWFDWVRNYMIARDLWEVVDGTIKRPLEDHNEDFANWRRKNAEALHIIQISCTPESFSTIKQASEAKGAWDILLDTYKYSPPPPQEQVNFDAAILYKAVCANDWSAAKAFLDDYPSALNAKLTSTGKTALHVAALFGYVDMVEEMVRLVPEQFLEEVDFYGFTPLAIATYSGVTQVAKCMVNKNSRILTIPTPENLLPVSLAFGNGHEEMGRYLYSITPLEVLKPEYGPMGSRLLHICLDSGNIDVVLHLLQQCEELLFASDKNGWTPIVGIAGLSSTFPSESQLVFWKRWIYIWLGQSHRLISYTYNFLGMKEIYELKLLHIPAAQILSIVCRNVTPPYRTANRKDIIADALHCAASSGNHKFVVEVAKANPELLLLVTFGLKQHIFFSAIKHRQAEVFNLFHGLRFKNALATAADASKNSMLHVAGMLAPSSQLNRMSGAALQMQRELQWFKEIERVVPPGFKILKNRDGKHPENVFSENHEELRKEGEKWMKETASSCSVVGALVVTIMFAAAFTVPGGNDQNSGYPIFLDKEKLFMLFVISDALSLFSSTTSVLMFLGILTSRYAEEDFLKSLPTKVIIGLSALFFSIATMMIAFSACILIMLQHRHHTWAHLPVIMLASAPVSLFGLLQFPLLVQMVSSTYGPGIFNRKVELWP